MLCLIFFSKANFFEHNSIYPGIDIFFAIILISSGTSYFYAQNVIFLTLSYFYGQRHLTKGLDYRHCLKFTKKSPFNFFTGKLEFLPTNKGPLPIFRRYTFSFSRSKKMLYCSRRIRAKCSARLAVDSDLNVVDGHFEHSHDPPIFRQGTDGMYVKLDYGRQVHLGVFL